MPMPDFAVPYEAPKHVNTMAEVQPIVPKKGLPCISGQDQGGYGVERKRWEKLFSRELHYSLHRPDLE